MKSIATFFFAALFFLPLTAMTASPLDSTSWTVSKLDGTALAADITPPTIEFHNENQISGNASCNQYGGTYTIEKQTISVSRLRLTRRMCDEETMTREHKFLAILQSATSWEISPQDTLTLHSLEGTLQAKRMPPDVQKN